MDAGQAATGARDEEGGVVGVHHDVAHGGSEMGAYELREPREVGVERKVDLDGDVGEAPAAEDADGSGSGVNKEEPKKG